MPSLPPNEMRSACIAGTLQDGTFLEWKLGEGSGTGTFRPDVSVCVLQFFMPGSTVTVTYVTCILVPVICCTNTPPRDWVDISQSCATAYVHA